MFDELRTPILHPYELLPLDVAGYILGGILILGHLVALLCPEKVQGFLKQAPRNETLGQILLAIGLFWFFLLVAPEGDGILNSLRVDMGGFEGIVPWLQICTPVAFFLLIFKLKEFLFVRSLGVLCLLFVAPLLKAAYLQEPMTRLLIPIWCYAVILLSLFWIGKPYLLRDQVAWVTATPGRWKLMAYGGLSYGVAILVCALFFWSK